MKALKLVLVLSMVTLVFSGCKKFLDEKPDKKLVVPNSINTIQGLLDNDVVMNIVNPGTGEVSADNYYVTDQTWAALTSNAQKNMYTWEDDITLSEYPNHWSRLYDVVTIANVALEGLDKITALPAEQVALNNAKGIALFFRAKSFLTAAGYWATAYKQSSAANDPGIPLRLNSDFEPITIRATLQQSYDQVIADLRQSIDLLPATQKVLQRPSKAAALGLLARTYLLMSFYDSAAVYADKSLQLNATLLNYNSISGATTYPIPLYNTETMVYMSMANPAILVNSRAIVDSSLVSSYATDDLRKSLYFVNNGNGTYGFRGNYTQSGALFTGIATDEIWLIKAECLARSGNLTAAMDALNSLLLTRWKTGTFVPFTASSAVAALVLVLQERRKELIFRDIRWMDLKRLNLEPAFQKIIYRRLNGKDYQLLPNDNRYALPIPSTVISMSGIAQNPR